MSFAFAILIFTLTLFIERPLDFSSFPAVLLAHRRGGRRHCGLCHVCDGRQCLYGADCLLRARYCELYGHHQRRGPHGRGWGDAVAGILITLLNLIAGIAIGIGVHKIGFGEAIKNYSILTVGDGLVSQIPAVIISIAAGLLLSKGKGEGTFDFALSRQFMQHPSALMAVAAIMLIFAFFPGLPFFPFLVGALLLGGAAYLSFKRAAKDTEDDATKTETSEDVPEKPLLGDALDIDEIHIELSKELAPARWVLKEHQDELIMLGIPTVEVTEVLATHLLEVVQANFTKLLTRRSLRETLETFKTVSDPERAESNKKILEE